MMSSGHDDQAARVIEIQMVVVVGVDLDDDDDMTFEERLRELDYHNDRLLSPDLLSLDL